MVVGPLMQGVVLAGIIYWYSKGMMSMINDYYRSEFNRKLKEVNETATGNESINYDLDNFENLLDVENVLKSAVSVESDEFEVVDTFMAEDWLSLSEQSCYAPNAIDIFLYLVGLNVSQQELECWSLNESHLEYKIS